MTTPIDRTGKTFLLLEEAVISDAGFKLREENVKIGEVERAFRRRPIVYPVSLCLLWKDKPTYSTFEVCQSVQKLVWTGWS